MSKWFTAHGYQVEAGEHLDRYPNASLFLDMGLGKTIVTLLAIKRRLAERVVKKVLVVAPKRVAEHTWTTEALAWDQTKGLVISVVAGTEKQRKTALRKPANIYTIGVDNFAWLVALFGDTWPFDYVVYDELSLFKSSKSKRFKAAKIIRPFVKRVTGQTGTPMSNGLMDLWSQLYILDGGKRLGTSIEKYRATYFDRGKQLANDTYSYDLKAKAHPLLGNDIYEKSISSKISDICISMKAEDYLDLPERIDENRLGYLEGLEYQRYLDFERDSVLQLYGNGQEINAVNAAVLAGKLLEYSNGAVYANKERTEYEEVHTHKIDLLGEALSAANGEGALVLYNFRHDVWRIKKHLGKDFDIHTMAEKNIIDQWNKNKIPVLIGHPKSMGHGLNMQKGGGLMFHFGVNWSLELYRQVIKRIHRQGREFRVLNSHLLMDKTIDLRVVQRLGEKGAAEDSLLDYIKARVKMHLAA